MVKKRISYILILALLLLTGCWDMIEIEERGFIIGASIDLKEKISENRYVVEITDQLAISSAFGPSQGGAGSDSEAYINLTASGENIMSKCSLFLKKSSRFHIYLKIY